MARIIREPRLGAALARWVGLCLLLGAGSGAGPARAAEPSHQASPLAVETAGKAGFVLMSPAQTGIGFANLLPESRHLTNQILLNGAGVAAGDVDGDGWVDLYFCATDGTNVLYRNRGGWRFERVVDAGGAGCERLTSTGASLVDLDGDRDLDLVVNTLANGTRLFLNDGGGRFRAHGQVLNAGAAGMTTAVGDVDGDGFPDLYVANYRSSGLMDMPNARATFRTVDGRTEVDRVNGRPVTDPEFANRFEVGPRGEIEELGEPDAFYRNLGGTNFVLQPFTGGTFLDEAGRPLPAPLREWGLCAMFRDLNGDTLPDLYVCNDFQSPDRLWINQGDGRLRLAPRATLRHTSRFSMAVDVADINRDGRDDLLVVDMLSRQHALRMRSTPDLHSPPDVVRDPLGCPQYGHNTLFLQGDGFRFQQVAHLAGLEASEWSWACVFLDVDLDGWEDVLVSNGMERAARDPDVVDRLQAMRAARRMTDAEIFEARRMFPRLATPNLAFRNRGDLTFEEVGTAWGFATPGVSQGMALADLDNDGDLDVVVNNLNGPAGAYRNTSTAPRIAVRLEGLPPNTRGIGARVRVTDAAGGVQSQEMISGGRYLSGDDTVRTFAALSPTNRMTIEVVWRSGRRSRVEQVEPNRLYVVREVAAAAGAAAGSGAPPAAAGGPLFEDVTARLAHRHAAVAFDDFQRQPLLPWTPGEMGPAVAWADLDGDGDDDLVIGAGRGSVPGVFVNDGRGGFQRSAGSFPVWGEDGAGLVADPQPDGKVVLLAGASSYADGVPTGAAIRRIGLGGTSDLALPGSTHGVVGALARADIDGDGDLDLFVAGRAIPGRYPEPSNSRLFLAEGNGFVPAAAPVFERVGLVNGCVFSDVDGDADPDLLLACEWGPIKLFLNDGGRFAEGTTAWRLADHTGLWTGIGVGDFDGDGRLDLVAGNFGANTRYQAFRANPIRLYYGDVEGDGRTEILEGWTDPLVKKEVPARRLDILGRVMPQLRDRFPTHRSFAAAGMMEVVKELGTNRAVVEARTFETAVFLNRGGHFERRVLPVEAQMAPAYGACVADVDGDGNHDIFLPQNKFGVNPEDTRLDGGRGLWLLGDGRGGFRVLAPRESGVDLLGEQRGAALGDFDGDGRLDLVVGQFGGETRLFRNRAGRPGLRVHLKGAAGNPTGVGAVLRVATAGGWGPANEVHAGSGIGCQDSTIAVVGTAGQVGELEVRWPGGRRDRLKVQPGQTQVQVAF